MSWADIANAAESIAPTIASTVLGPLGGLGVSAIEKVFGLTPSASLAERTDAAATAIAGATPDQLIALKKADQDFQVQMASLGFKDTETLAGLKVQDTESARTMQTSNRSWIPAALTILVTVGFFGLLIALFKWSVPEGSKALIYSATGTLGTVWLVVIHFWFGSTSDTAQVNNLLASSTPAASQK